jgi:hypothetical protein
MAASAAGENWFEVFHICKNKKPRQVAATGVVSD